MKNTLIAIIVLAVIGGGIYLYAAQDRGGSTAPENMGGVPENTSVVTDGTYAVDPTQSSIMWAGKKPLIEGYINTGSLAVSEGTITVAGEEVSGAFTMDMDTLSVSATPTKPGQENALEGHLKGERWFNVAAYPNATFEITEVSPREDSESTRTYDVTGTLTLKGKTNTVSFPAQIYLAEDGTLRASGTVSIDRTQWDITANSENFFDNLAENVIDDMIALEIKLVATKQ